VSLLANKRILTTTKSRGKTQKVQQSVPNHAAERNIHFLIIVAF